MNGKLTSGFGYIQALMESRQDQKRVRKSFLLWPIFKANIGDLRDSFVSKPSQLITWLKEHVTRRKSHRDVY